ncbi:MAG: DUF3465 domain-containing protein [Bacteriovorax sp.]
MKSLIAFLILAVSFSSFAFVPEQECKDRKGNVLTTNLSQIIKIMHNNDPRGQIYVTGTIAQIQAEDRNGRSHQKFILNVSKDITLSIVSNLEFGRIPLVVGKIVSICGEFLHVGKGMVHWTHFDPHGGHADGFTILDGKLYGDKEVPVN